MDASRGYSSRSLVVTWEGKAFVDLADACLDGGNHPHLWSLSPDILDIRPGVAEGFLDLIADSGCVLVIVSELDVEDSRDEALKLCDTLRIVSDGKAAKSMVDGHLIELLTTPLDIGPQVLDVVVHGVHGVDEVRLLIVSGSRKRDNSSLKESSQVVRR